MRTIISRTINSEVSPRISLGSDEIYRPLSVGGNWNKLRIGLSLVFTYPGANLAGQPRFFVGKLERPRPRPGKHRRYLECQRRASY